jgi:hypothetical protein
MFRHSDAILRELLKQSCTSQPAIIYVFFIVTRLTKTLVATAHKIYKIDIVNNLQCFDNTLIIIRRGSCQLLESVF